MAGHRPLALVGGSTGLIGDPHPDRERVLNAPDVVAGWVDRIKGQVEPFFSFDGPNAARIVNNLDSVASSRDDDKQISFRVDHNFSESYRIFGRYSRLWNDHYEPNYWNSVSSPAQRSLTIGVPQAAASNRRTLGDQPAFTMSVRVMLSVKRWRL